MFVKPKSSINRISSQVSKSKTRPIPYFSSLRENNCIRLELLILRNMIESQDGKLDVCASLSVIDREMKRSELI